MPTPINASQATSDFKGDHLSVKMFGAVGDATTDDTAALQAAINFAQSSRCSLYVPPGIYRITGSGLRISGQLSMYGMAGIGLGAPAFRYEGTGTALEIRDAISVNNFIYAVHLRNLAVLIAPGFSAAKGIAMYTLSGGIFENVGVAGSPTSTLATGWYLYQSGIIEIRRPLVSYSDTGFWFDGSNVNFPNGPVMVDRGDFFQNFTAAFKVNYGSSLTLRDNWIESPGVVMLCDNTASDIGVSKVELSGNRILFNGIVNGRAGLSDLILKVTAAPSKIATIYKLVMRGNDVLVPDGTANGIDADLVSGAFGSSVDLTFSDNFVDGYSGALIVANDSRIRVALRDNATNSGGVPQADLSGTATMFSSSAQCVGRNTKSPPSSDTTFYVKDSVAATTVRIDEGAAQGFTGLLTFADATGHTIGQVLKDGSTVWGGGQTWFDVATGLPLWKIDDSATGRHWALFRYDSSGVFSGAVLNARRDTGRVGISTATPGAGFELVNPDSTVPTMLTRAAPSQTADLLQLFNSANPVTPQFSVGIGGAVSVVSLTAGGNVTGGGTDMASLLALTASLQAQINTANANISSLSSALAGKANSGSYTTGAPSAGAAHTHSVSI